MTTYIICLSEDPQLTEITIRDMSESRFKSG